MPRKIDKVEVSETFWQDLEPLRREPWYRDLREGLSRFITSLYDGEATKDRGFSNPKLKGIYHLNLPRNQRLFHVYEGDTVRLCLLVDHKAYGFKGKHRSHETNTAEKISRMADLPGATSPQWSKLRWKEPSDLLDNPELCEMSEDGLRSLIDEIDNEGIYWDRLVRKCGVESLSEIPYSIFETWAEDLVDAQDQAYAALESIAMKRRKPLEREDFEAWIPDGP